MTDFPTTMNIHSDDNAAMMEAFGTSDLTSPLSPPPPLPLASTSTANHTISLTHLRPSPQDPMPLSLDTLQERLKALIKAARENWTYAIFWESSPLDGSICWGDGYYMGEEDTGAVSSSLSAEDQAYRKKVLRELDFLINGRIVDSVDEDVTDAEWFFLVSMSQSFGIGSGLPGQALFNSFPIMVAGAKRLAASQCERARQGQVFGLRTMVCIPTVNGVVELGSTGFPRNSIVALWELVKQTIEGITGEAEMVEEGDQLKFGCLGNGKRKEKIRGGESGNKKTGGVRIEIGLEDILQTEGMTLKHAAKNLNVSRSTRKRACWEYGIHRWPPRKKHKLINQSQPNESPAVFDQEQIPQLNSVVPLLSDHGSATINTNTVTVKARYGKVTIKFMLSWPWRKIELEQEVEKRLKFEAGTYHIYYKEDNELILLACDEDLQDYISSSSLLGSNYVEVFLAPKVANEFRVEQG